MFDAEISPGDLVRRRFSSVIEGAGADVGIVVSVEDSPKNFGACRVMFNANCSAIFVNCLTTSLVKLNDF